MLLPITSYVPYAPPYKGAGFHLDKEEEDYDPLDQYEGGYETLDDLTEYHSDLLEQRAIARLAGEEDELVDIEIELESIEAEIQERRRSLIISQ